MTGKGFSAFSFNQYQPVKTHQNRYPAEGYVTIYVTKIIGAAGRELGLGTVTLTDEGLNRKKSVGSFDAKFAREDSNL
jgi:hypothetical protein